VNFRNYTLHANEIETAPASYFLLIQSERHSTNMG
jgi:hypothetical protein